MILRWYRQEIHTKYYDSRWNEWVTKVYFTEPVLQMEIGNNHWVTIPTIIEVVKDEQSIVS